MSTKSAKKVDRYANRGLMMHHYDGGHNQQVKILLVYDNPGSYDTPQITNIFTIPSRYTVEMLMAKFHETVSEKQYMKCNGNRRRALFLKWMADCSDVTEMTNHSDEMHL